MMALTTTPTTTPATTTPTEPAWSHLTERARPLWAGLRTTLGLFKGKPTIDQLNQAARRIHLTNTLGLPIQFQAQEVTCGQRQYETQIYEQGLVPTRAGHWHDILNACMWLTYPKTKAALNAIHIKQHGATPIRTRASDTATLFDESGAILIGPDSRLAQWLTEHDWKSAWVTHRHLWRTHRLLVVGHAVLEKLATPYPGMIAKVIHQPWPAITANIDSPPPGLDEQMAARWLSQEFSLPAQLFPLPVLGVPDADPDNADPMFYENTNVFRPKRDKITTNTTTATHP